MPRLEKFTLEVKTGERGREDAPRYEINGFTLDFDALEGGTGPGETLKLTGQPESFPHSLVLTGPEQGAWDIEEVHVVYHVDGGEPYTVRMGAVTLEDDANLNIWHPRPARVIEV